MPTYPAVAASLDRLRRAGWSIGDTGTASAWRVVGTNGENCIRAEGRTRAEAWCNACAQARDLGMLAPARERGAGVAVLLGLSLAALAFCWWRLAPAPPGPLGDLGTDAVALLRALPGVVRVDRDGPTGRPSHRLVHLRDWHLIPPESHALDAGRRGECYEDHLAAVEACQRGQQRLLGALVDHHALRVLLAEGRGAERTARQGRGRIEQHRRDRLGLGAAGWLAAERGAEVLPLDYAGTPDAADPRHRAGKPDPARVKGRQAAIVRRALDFGPVAVLLLGGEHDLAAEVRGQTGGRGEYLRVTAEGYPGPARR